MAHTKLILKVTADSKKATTNNEADALKALAAVKNSGLQENSWPCYSLRKAALDYGVVYQKLTRWYNRIESREKAHVPQQALTPLQETIVVKWAKSLGQRGILWSSDVLREKALLVAGYELSRQ